MATVTGGTRLGPALKRIAEKLSNASEVRVGFLEKAKYQDGTSVAMVAATQDFGAPARGIPPRPFFRNMIAEKKGEWPEAVGNLLIANGFDARKTLRMTGEEIAGQLRQSIIDTNSPPLSPKTIARKSGAMTASQKRKLEKLKASLGIAVLGPEKPLVATGVMLGSVDSEVK